MHGVGQDAGQPRGRGLTVAEIEHGVGVFVKMLLEMPQQRSLAAAGLPQQQHVAVLQGKGIADG